jgi:predicted HicB family RNase H-like nuclease
MLCARVPVELHDEVKLLAVRRRTSVQAIVTEAIGAYLST